MLSASTMRQVNSSGKQIFSTLTIAKPANGDIPNRRFYTIIWSSLHPAGPGQNVVALDKMTGEQIWSIDLDSAVNAYNSPLLIRHRGEDFIS